MALHSCQRCHRHRCCCCERDDFPLSFKDPDRDIIPPSEMPITYTVVPYDYSHLAGRKGTVYQIVEQHFLANAKTPEAARHIVDKLNSVRRLERDLSAQQVENGKLRRTSMTPETVRQAVIKEYVSMPHCRWSSNRKAVVDFGKGVLKRLGMTDHGID